MRKVYDAKEKPDDDRYVELHCPGIAGNEIFTAYCRRGTWFFAPKSLTLLVNVKPDGWREIEPWDTDPARPRASELEWHYDEEPPKDRRFIVEIDCGIRIAIWDSVVGEWSAEAIRKTDGGAWVTIHGIERWADFPERLKVEEPKPVVESPPEAEKPPPWLCPKCGKARLLRKENKWNFLYCFGCHSSESVSDEIVVEIERSSWQSLNAMRELAQDILNKWKNITKANAHWYVYQTWWYDWAKAILGEEPKREP